MMIIGALALIVVVSTSAAEIVYPAGRVKVFVTHRLWPCLTGIFRGAIIEAENQQLRQELNELKMIRTTHARVEAENARLRHALDYAVREPEKWISAEITSFGGSAAGVYDVIRINKGSLAGISEGAIVVVPEGLVGRVKAVTPHTAEIRLITDISQKVACTIGSGASGILSGGGKGQLVLRHLLNAKTLRPHTPVVTSGLGGVFPAGLVVGDLQIVITGAHGLEGIVQPAVDFSSLERVFVRHDRPIR